MPYDLDFIAGHDVPLPISSDRVIALAFQGEYIHDCAIRCCLTRNAVSPLFRLTTSMEPRYQRLSSQAAVSKMIRISNPRCCG